MGSTASYNAMHAHILQDAAECEGVPYIAHSTVTVLDIYESYQLIGISAEDIMLRYTLTPVQTFAALTFIFEFEQDVARMYERLRNSAQRF